MQLLRELQQPINKNARDKGFYADRDHGEETRLSMVALTHSEVSEALECVREGGSSLRLSFLDKASGEHFLYQDEQLTRKPVGLPSELADIVIRALDYAYYFNISFNEPDHTAFGEYKLPTPRSAAAWIANLHQNVADDDIGVLLQECYNLASAYRFDLDEAILAKMAYNSTRTPMHDGKTL